MLSSHTGLIVTRFKDHRLLKGTTSDFHPDRPKFHLVPATDPEHPLAIEIGDLKLVCFVRSFEGDRSHVAANDFGGAAGQGRRIEVEFQDGEVLRGFTVGYNPKKLGFFVVPADPGSNNTRVFVVNTAVRRVTWL